MSNNIICPYGDTLFILSQSLFRAFGYVSCAAWLVCPDEPLVLCGACLRHEVKGGPTKEGCAPFEFAPFENPPP